MYGFTVGRRERFRFFSGAAKEGRFGAVFQKTGRNRNVPVFHRSAWEEERSLPCFYNAPFAVSLVVGGEGKSYCRWRLMLCFTGGLKCVFCCSPGVLLMECVVSLSVLLDAGPHWGECFIFAAAAYSNA
ncbi:hypothetical protein [Rufibacter ruber]|uniref:hypothetical protein n=1 Tax=Rufibacter ruber TaxID=1783499 RepID=UPI00129002B2|nr:hypothetical protein [Rufibacter ruber]